MNKTVYYQNRIVITLALILFLFVAVRHLKKQVDNFAYVELHRAT